MPNQVVGTPFLRSIIQKSPANHSQGIDRLTDVHESHARCESALSLFNGSRYRKILSNLVLLVQAPKKGATMYSRVMLVAFSVLMGLIVFSVPASATFPGKREICFIQGADIFTMNADGSEVRQLTSYTDDNPASRGELVAKRKAVSFLTILCARLLRTIVADEFQWSQPAYLAE